jgi:hypothetical protein
MPIIKKHQLRCQLLFTDTDSLAFEIFIENSDIKNDVELFKEIHKEYKCMDFSSWPKDHELRFENDPVLDCKNFKKKPFTFGSEFVPRSFDDTDYRPDIYIGIKAKQYLFANSKTADCNIKSKGIPKAIAKKCLNLENFKAIANGDLSQLTVKYKTLQSKNNGDVRFRTKCINARNAFIPLFVFISHLVQNRT